MRNTTLAGKLLERLRLDPDFRRIWYTAYVNGARKKECIQQARKLFNLSPIWEEIFLPIIFSESPSNQLSINLSIAQPIREKLDVVTDQTFYLLPIYPESTLEEVKKAYAKINAKYKEEGRKVNIRQSSPELDKIQYLALELKNTGKTYQQIAEEINDTFDNFYTKEEIPLLIQRAKEKSNR